MLKCPSNWHLKSHYITLNGCRQCWMILFYLLFISGAFYWQGQAEGWHLFQGLSITAEKLLTITQSSCCGLVIFSFSPDRNWTRALLQLNSGVVFSHTYPSVLPAVTFSKIASELSTQAVCVMFYLYMARCLKKGAVCYLRTVQKSFNQHNLI